jgi:hypothetical protein
MAVSNLTEKMFLFPMAYIKVVAYQTSQMEEAAQSQFPRLGREPIDAPCIVRDSRPFH